MSTTFDTSHYSFPASFAQRRMWFVQETVSDSSVYHVPLLFKLKGNIDLEILQDSIDHLVERHESLRTYFAIKDSDIAQIIIPEMKCDIQYIVVPDDELEKVEERILTHIREPFLLYQAPLFRVYLYRVNMSEHYLLLNMHHIITDGWSCSILLRELSILYSSKLKGEEAHLPYLEIQVADFAQWQKDYLQGEQLEKQLRFWEEHLKGDLPILDLPVPSKRIIQYDNAGASFDFHINNELSEQFLQLCNSKGTTLYIGLLTVYKVLLARSSGQLDIVVGTPIANRNHNELENIVGMFVNTMALRTDVEHNPTFNELLAYVRETMLEAYDYQDVPFDLVVERLSPERNLGQTPIFQAMFSFQNYSKLDLKLEGTENQLVDITLDTAKFELYLDMTATEEGLQGVFEYQKHLYDQPLMEQLSRHFIQLIEQIVKDEQQQIWNISFQDDEINRDNHQLSVPTWGSIQTPELNGCHERFEYQAKLVPHQVAIRYQDTSITYKQLNEKANQIASYLIKSGIEAGSNVGLWLEPSIDFIASMLAIWKVGGCCVPLHLSHPVSRNQKRLKEAGVYGTITNKYHAKHLTQFEKEIFYLEHVNYDVQHSANLDQQVANQQSACIYWGAGSSTDPIVVPHYRLLHLNDSAKHKFAFDEKDIWTLLQPLDCELALWEIGGALFCGATLIVVPDWMHEQMEYVWELVKLEKVTRMTLSCNSLITWKQLSHKHAPGKLMLRMLFIKGKTIILPPMKEWLEQYIESSSQMQFVHLHSLSSWGGVISSRFLAPEGNQYQRIDRMIGTSLCDQSLYILDEAENRVPSGITGTLYISETDSCSSALFHERLADKRWSYRSDLREGNSHWLYRTDDVCRLWPDEQIEWLYNKNNEIEIDGSPILIEEIYEAFMNHPHILEAEVKVNVDQELVAYLISDIDKEIMISEIKYYLGENLPENWIPKHIYMVNQLSEKLIEGHSLLNHANSTAEVEVIQPNNETEEKLIDIWKQVLQLDQLSVNDNYFVCGGDSIRMLSMIALAKEYDMYFSIRDVLSYQTIKTLAPKVMTISNKEKPNNNRYDLISLVEHAKLPDDVEEAYPLTQLQQGMLFQNELHPHSKLYHDLIQFSIQGRFEKIVWEQALGLLIERHPVLRTTFDLSHYESPLQLVHTHRKMLINYVDERNNKDEEYKIHYWINEEMNTPFEWRQSLIRIRIVHLAENHIYLMLVMHHAILDGWSVAHFTTELFETVDILLQGKKLKSNDSLKASFKDHVREELNALRSEEQRDYWQHKLHEFSRTLLPRWEMPKPSSPVMQLKELDVPNDLSLTLRKLAKNTLIPLKSWLIAIHMQVLKTVTNQKDITSGVLFHGRPEQKDGDRVLGLFLNTLPFRLRLDGGNWLSIAEQAWETEKEMLQYRHYPMAQIQQDIGGNPLFETFFNFTHFYVSEQKIGSYNELHINEKPGYADNSFPFGAEFSLEGDKGELRLSLRWDQSLFSDEQIRRISGYYLQAMHYATYDTYAQADHQILLTSAELEEIKNWNDTSYLFPKVHLLHTLFEQQAAYTPDEIAIIYGDQQLSYRKCNEQANRLAHYFIKHGLDKEMKVGVCLERSADLPIILLAILKAGGAYVPLDPQHPVHYMEEIVHDAEPTFIITSQQSIFLFERSRASILDIEKLLLNISKESCENPNILYDSGQLAYMIYTSGSTGKPKGVLIEHQAIANRLLWMQEEFQLSGDDRVLQKTPFTFDVSVWEFFWPLIAGAVLVLAEPGGHKNPKYLLDIIQQHQITIIHFVPSMLHTFLIQPGIEQCVSLQKVICSGEALSPFLQEKFFEKLSCKLYNLYGPTEAAVDVTSWECHKDYDIVPIGMPIANVYIRVLNKNGLPVGVGVPGELYIGGICLARGYHNRPALNTERFISDPFSDDSSARLYKTGDEGRYLTNGAIEYLGRLDHQVKIRGFRIEMGDIESKLVMHSQVAECALCTIKDVHDIQLIACIVPYMIDNLPEIEELYEHLKLYVPEYMIPTRWIWLEKMPLTASGKIDRKALERVAVQDHSQHKHNYRTASNVVEHRLLKLWEKILGVQVPGVNESFFHWGGHSLLAIQLVVHIEREFGKKLPLSAILEHPTIERLAMLIDADSIKLQLESGLIALNTSGSQIPLFCIHPVGGSAMCYHTFPEAIGKDWPVYAIQDQRLNAHSNDQQDFLPLVSIKQLATQYIQHIQTVQPKGPYSLLGWSFGGVVAHEMAYQLEQTGHEVAHLILLDSRVSHLQEDQLHYSDEELKHDFLNDLKSMQQLEEWQESIYLCTENEENQNDYFYRVFLSNYQAMIEHIPERFGGKILWFGAKKEEQTLNTVDWQPYAEDVHTVILEADHYSIMNSKHVKTIVSYIKPYIAETKE
ncbi:Dimodular nonribosomal peptide synthase [Paenibacillus nuruki]|uniref:Dimodular nonribosomal peptide synthase n=1 Tax=Paenibacillus nuruki TaxID=1886670 RepID=A0A1E3L8I9_9BACL|nr:non-ribosomal peptide synthetase [Paenibacillus nuruki]ODP30122.1 Dimodular nonribosomal peptide synthase [Paenibacillus nuruki]